MYISDLYLLFRTDQIHITINVGWKEMRKIKYVRFDKLLSVFDHIKIFERI